MKAIFNDLYGIRAKEGFRASSKFKETFAKDIIALVNSDPEIITIDGAILSFGLWAQTYYDWAKEEPVKTAHNIIKRIITERRERGIVFPSTYGTNPIGLAKVHHIYSDIWKEALILDATIKKEAESQEPHTITVNVKKVDSFKQNVKE